VPAPGAEWRTWEGNNLVWISPSSADLKLLHVDLKPKDRQNLKLPPAPKGSLVANDMEDQNGTEAGPREGSTRGDSDLEEDERDRREESEEHHDGSEDEDEKYRWRRRRQRRRG
jgi:hypothetical protein